MMRFLRFAIIGVINTSVDFGIFVGLTRLSSDPLLANVASYSCGIFVSFILNSHFTFRGRPWHIEALWIRFAAFCGVNIAALLLASILIIVLVPWCGPVLAKALSIPPTMIFNYLMASQILSSHPSTLSTTPARNSRTSAARTRPTWGPVREALGEAQPEAAAKAVKQHSTVTPANSGRK